MRAGEKTRDFVTGGQGQTRGPTSGSARRRGWGSAAPSTAARGRGGGRSEMRSYHMAHGPDSAHVEKGPYRRTGAFPTTTTVLQCFGSGPAEKKGNV